MAMQVACPSGCRIELRGEHQGKLVTCPSCQATIRIPRRPPEGGGDVLIAHWVADPGELDGEGSGEELGGRGAPEALPSDSGHSSDASGQWSSPMSPAELAGDPQRSGRGRDGGRTRDAGAPSGTRGPDADSTAARESEGSPASRDAGSPFAFLSARKSVDPEEWERAISIETDATGDLDPVHIEVDREGKADSRNDRVWLTRFYAFCLSVIGLIHGIPLLAFAISSESAVIEQPLPRWSVLLLFSAILFIVYAIYLWQLIDWSSLLTVSLFVLGMASLFGFIAASLWLGNAKSDIAQWLQLTPREVQLGPIWGGILCSLTALASFVFGRDALAWQRKAKRGA